MGTLEFPDLGSHCSVDSCQLIDFLPFKCDQCKQTFCLDHRLYSNHSCPKATAGDASVILCPICTKSVRMVSNENPNMTWERHVSTNCNPDDYAKAAKKKRCPVKGCKENLTFSNTITCKDCHQTTCLKHRFGPDHSCADTVKQAKANARTNFWGGAVSGTNTGNRVPTTNTYFGESLLTSFRESVGLSVPAEGGGGGGVGGGGGGRSSANKASGRVGGGGGSGAGGRLPEGGRGATGVGRPAAKATGVAAGHISHSANDSSNTVKGTAHRRAEEWDWRKRGEAQSKGLGSGQPIVAGGGPEKCPQCTASFQKVEDLISHVDRDHLGGGGSGNRGGSGGGGSEQCPKCGKEFGNVVALIAHAEKEHVGSSRDGSNCSIS